MKKAMMFFILFFNQKQYTMLEVGKEMATFFIKKLNYSGSGLKEIFSGNGSFGSNAVNATICVVTVASSGYLMRVLCGKEAYTTWNDLVNAQEWNTALKQQLNLTELIAPKSISLYLFFLFLFGCAREYGKNKTK